jgi:hypothetical protein
MTAHFLTLIAFALAATASPVVLVRDDTPKPAKSGSGGRAGSGSTPAPASSGSSSGGLSSFAGLGGKHPLSSIDPSRA